MLGLSFDNLCTLSAESEFVSGIIDGSCVGLAFEHLGKKVNIIGPRCFCSFSVNFCFDIFSFARDNRNM